MLVPPQGGDGSKSCLVVFLGSSRALHASLCPIILSKMLFRHPVFIKLWREIGISGETGLGCCLLAAGRPQRREPELSGGAQKDTPQPLPLLMASGLGNGDCRLLCFKTGGHTVLIHQGQEKSLQERKNLLNVCPPSALVPGFRHPWASPLGLQTQAAPAAAAAARVQRESWKWVF